MVGMLINIWQKPKIKTIQINGFGHRVYKTLIHVLKSSKGCRWSVRNFRCWWSDSCLEVRSISFRGWIFQIKKPISQCRLLPGIIYFRNSTDMFTVMFAIGRLPGGLPSGKKCVKIKSLLVDQGNIYWIPLWDFKTVDKR
jgi:citrate synthase